MEELCENIMALGYQFILIDCPAGIDVGFINAISPAKEGLIITTPEITSIRDAGARAGVCGRVANTCSMQRGTQRPLCANACTGAHARTPWKLAGWLAHPRVACRVTRLVCVCTRAIADRVAGLLEANGVYNVKLLVNRVRPEVRTRTHARTAMVVMQGAGRACYSPAAHHSGS